jgi:hypothetical protein
MTSFSMSVEQSCGPPGPGSVGFGGSEESEMAGEDVAAAAGDVAAAEDVVAEPEAASALPEDFELVHPATSDTAASEVPTATPSRMPIERLASEVFISSSMPWTAAGARTNPAPNPTTFTVRSCAGHR